MPAFSPAEVSTNADYTPGRTEAFPLGSDSQVIIWSLAKKTREYTVNCKSYGDVTDILWASLQPNLLYLIFSTADGSIHVFNVKLDTHQRTIHAFTQSVQKMDFDIFHNRLAAVGQGELKVWDIDQDWSISLLATVTSSGLIAKTVHFFDDGQCILAGYMESHWIRIPKAAISPSGRYFLVHNMRTGCDAYTIPEMGRHALSTFSAPVTSRKPIGVGFASGGSLVMQGGSRGRLYLHRFESATLFQTLQHRSRGLLQAIDGHSFRDQHWIAGAMSTEPYTIQLWNPKSLSKWKDGKKIQALVLIPFILCLLGFGCIYPPRLGIDVMTTVTVTVTTTPEYIEPTSIPPITEITYMSHTTQSSNSMPTEARIQEASTCEMRATATCASPDVALLTA
ncbi:hypothetical protein M422DRAFT_51577 [Sphaerobolus stellatus SS14]|uniref:Uncharacterized protein n=1 Tax=Sphaerobolus stellatus (strain SS14) TaxID=990650 RepID=A0A0C9UKF6_SPHS4|nr:hypothetical protein M422DRAFT_51577 [Sphaerobolus stellatus SS14]